MRDRFRLVDRPPCFRRGGGWRRRHRLRSRTGCIRCSLQCRPRPDWTAWARSVARDPDGAPSSRHCSVARELVFVARPVTKVERGCTPRLWQRGARKGAVFGEFGVLGMRPVYAKTSARSAWPLLRARPTTSAECSAYTYIVNMRSSPRAIATDRSKQGGWSSGANQSRTTISILFCFKICRAARPRWTPPDAPMPMG